MEFVIPLLLASVCMYIAAQFWKKRRNAPNREVQIFREALEEEHRTYVPQKPLEPELLFVPDVSLLPVRDYTEAEQAALKAPAHQQKVVQQTAQQMVRFKEPLTNRELKARYGTAQLEDIARCEENYVRLMHMLAAWAEALLKEDEEDAAVRVLEAGVAYGSDVSRMFAMLAEIYTARSDAGGLHGLRAAAARLAEPMRGRIEGQIEQSIAQIERM